MKPRYLNGFTVQCGPLKFKRRDDGTDEAWDVVLPKDVQGSHFCVKDYGGKPVGGQAFTGWRVVSGGPFTDAGGWASRDEAIEGATPWLIAYYKRDADERAAKAEAIAKATRTWLSSL